MDGNVDSSYLGNHTEVGKLKELVKQRDNEISILCQRLIPIIGSAVWRNWQVISCWDQS